jgi:cell division protein FtsQ
MFILGGIAVVVLAVAAANSPFFHVRSLRVTAEGRLGADQVAKLSGVSSRDNLIFLNTSLVRDRLLTSPWIGSASVNKDYPGTLVISVAERSPVAAVGSGRDYVLVSSDGTALVPASSAGRYPTISGVAAPAVGKKIASGVAAAEVAASMSLQTRAQVAAIQENADGTVTATLRTGGSIDYGLPTFLSQKSAALAALLVRAAAQHLPLWQADLSAPQAPSARFGYAPSPSPVSPSASPSAHASPSASPAGH